MVASLPNFAGLAFEKIEKNKNFLKRDYSNTKLVCLNYKAEVSSFCFLCLVMIKYYQLEMQFFDHDCLDQGEYNSLKSNHVHVHFALIRFQKFYK